MSEVFFTLTRSKQEGRTDALLEHIFPIMMNDGTADIVVIRFLLCGEQGDKSITLFRHERKFSFENGPVEISIYPLTSCISRFAVEGFRNFVISKEEVNKNLFDLQIPQSFLDFVPSLTQSYDGKPGFRQLSTRKWEIHEGLPTLKMLLGIDF